MRPVCAALLLSTILLSAPAPAAAQQDTLRVFFLGRSEFGANGGIPAPFQEVCVLAGVPCRAYRHWDFVEHDRRNGLPASYPRLAANRHVHQILTNERFDAIFLTLFGYNSEFYRPDVEYVADMLTALDSLYVMMARSGAQVFLTVGYATLDNPKDTVRITRGSRTVQARIDSVSAARGLPRAVLVPGGRFFNAMALELGTDRWFADPLHASKLGQYAMARFFFSCVTQRDPGSFGHPARISERDARRIDAGIARLIDACRTGRHPS